MPSDPQSCGGMCLATAAVPLIQSIFSEGSQHVVCCCGFLFRNFSSDGEHAIRHADCINRSRCGSAGIYLKRSSITGESLIRPSPVEITRRSPAKPSKAVLLCELLRQTARQEWGCHERGFTADSKDHYTGLDLWTISSCSLASSPLGYPRTRKRSRTAVSWSPRASLPSPVSFRCLSHATLVILKSIETPSELPVRSASYERGALLS